MMLSLYSEKGEGGGGGGGRRRKSALNVAGPLDVGVYAHADLPSLLEPLAFWTCLQPTLAKNFY